MKSEKINEQTKQQLKVKTSIKVGRTAEEIARCIEACTLRTGGDPLGICPIQCSK